MKRYFIFMGITTMLLACGRDASNAIEGAAAVTEHSYENAVKLTEHGAEASQGTLKIVVKGIRDTKGTVRLTVFDHEEGFPSNPKEAVRMVNVPANSNEVTVEVPNLPRGQYAVALLHDKNSNTKLDTNIFGYPIERYGTSNNVRVNWRAPRFDEAAFRLTSARQTLVIELM